MGAMARVRDGKRVGDGAITVRPTDFLDPSVIDTRYHSRSISFENPSGARGAGGTKHGGRKGAPARRIEAGERVVLADIEGPGTVRHLWLTVFPARPEVLRALLLEVTYDGLAGPSVSVPLVDFFGVPHGRPVPYASVLTTIQEGRGFNSYLPMPFGARFRLEFVNASARAVPLFYSLDYTLDPPDDDRPASHLHVSWRRENPTTLGRDFVIIDGLDGPGRFVGCNVGVRVLDKGDWYGEGEVKVYLDGDRDHPTICGTGLEDYVGSAWGMGPHAAPYAGAPLEVRPPDPAAQPQPDFVGFYRWHVPDPILFSTDLRVTIQQIGIFLFRAGQEDEFERRKATRVVAGEGWLVDPSPGLVGQGIVERVDDYCATAFVYCERPQMVTPVDVELAVADIERRPYEQRERI